MSITLRHFLSRISVVSVHESSWLGRLIQAAAGKDGGTGCPLGNRSGDRAKAACKAWSPHLASGLRPQLMNVLGRVAVRFRPLGPRTRIQRPHRCFHRWVPPALRKRNFHHGLLVSRPLSKFNNRTALSGIVSVSAVVYCNRRKA